MMGTPIDVEIRDELRSLLSAVMQGVLILEEIAAALREPEPTDPTGYTCKCAKALGTPVANCPLCAGTGQS